MLDIETAWRTLKWWFGIHEPQEYWLEKLEVIEAKIRMKLAEDAGKTLRPDLFSMKRNQMTNTNRIQCRLAGKALAPRQNKVIVDSTSGEVCFQRKGVITAKSETKGTIDYKIEFSKDLAMDLFRSLEVGYHVEYIAYKQSDETIKLVRVLRVVNEFWDTLGENFEEEIQEQIQRLQDEKTTFFRTNERNIIGKVKSVLGIKIIVNTEHQDVEIISSEVDFENGIKPKCNDCVCLECLVQMDEDMVDMQGEILNVLKVKPARIMKDVPVMVTQVYTTQAEFGDAVYMLKEDVPKDVMLELDDKLVVDMVECMHGRYSWRCIRISTLNGLSVETPVVRQTIEEPAEPQKPQLSERAVAIIGEPCYEFKSADFPKMITLKVKNTSGKEVRLIGIKIQKRRDSVLWFKEPRRHVDISPGGTCDVIFEVKRFARGKHREPLIFLFSTLHFSSDINISVDEDELKDEFMSTGRNISNPEKTAMELRSGANKIWNRKAEIVKGQRGNAARRFISCRINDFVVPEDLRDIFVNVDCRRGIEDNIERLYPYLRQKLSYENYVKRFQALVYIEEIETFIKFRNFDRERAHFVQDGEYLSLTVDNLAERRPSLCIGDVVRAIDLWPKANGDDRCYDGIIQKILCNRILLKFNSSFHTSYNGADYRLEFLFSRYSIRKQHHALQIIGKRATKNFLFPETVTLREKPQLDVIFDATEQKIFHCNQELKWYNPSLNAIQKRAIYNILRGEVENMPYIIYGPPGTGKTLTVVETVVQLIKNLPAARILVATPSNSAADLITQRLVDCDALQIGDYVRILSQTQIEKEAVPEALMPYCATVDLGLDGTCENKMIVTDSGLRLGCQSKYLSRRRIIIGTLSTLGNFMAMKQAKDHFTHVVIDEAVQTTEPEAMIPISMILSSRGQVILAGDPNQLQSVVQNKYAGETGLSLSLLERILLCKPYLKNNKKFPSTSGYNPQLVTKLINNYRALPSIMKVYNDLFYDAELISMVSEQESAEIAMLNKVSKVIGTTDADKNARTTQGAFFYGILGVDQQGEDSPSWYNQSEAKAVFLMTVKLFRMGIQPDNIGIVTPYIKQVKYLRSLFSTTSIDSPKIGSVEEFQGQERDIILISTVRSTECQVESDLAQSLGFIYSAKRMNVAVSRARALLVVFGNPHLLGKDSNWRSLIRHCAENKSYYGCAMPSFNK